MSTNNRILHTRNVSIGFSGKKDNTRAIYSDINVSAGESELVALFGPNGIGKSTLLRSLVRLLSPVSGDIYLYENNINSLSGNNLAKQVGFVSTETVSVNNLTVYDLVSLGRYPYTGWLGRLHQQDIEKVEDAINMVGISSLRNKYINQISDGERQRTMIAKTLAQDTAVIVLDEPTAFLDLPNKYEVVHLLHKLAGERGKTIVFSTHDLNIAIQEADKIWLMLPEGIMQGSPEDLILEGSFGKMFEHTNLMFNTGKGEFRIKRDLRRRTGLRGPKKEVWWTRNALERIGIEVRDNESNDIMITITFIGGKRLWKVSAGNSTRHLESIYDLCVHLADIYTRDQDYQTS